MGETAVEVESLSADELEAKLSSWAGSVAASEYRWLRLVAEYDRRELYERWECQSCARWLMWHCGLNQRAATEKVRVGHGLEALPLISEAFSLGQLSYSKVRAITRVATPASESALLAYARATHTSGLERIVAACRRARRLNSGDADAVRRERSCNVRHDDDGIVTLTVRLPAEDYAIVAKALDVASTVEPKERSAEQRRADAVVAVAAGFLDGGTGSSGGDRYQVIVNVDAADLADGDATIDGAGPIDNDTLRRLCCDASLITLVEDDDGQPVAVSNKTRTIPAALRRALRARDKACRFPGCPNTAWTDAHHRQHWIDGGPTTLDNLLLLCRHHHRAVHEGRWTIEHDEHGRLRFRNKADCRYAETLQPDITELPNDIAPQTILPDWHGDPIDLPYVTAVVAHLDTTDNKAASDS